MQQFDYKRADNTDGAVQAHAGQASAYLAGGTTLIDLVKLDVMQPERLVDVNRLDLHDIERDDGGRLKVGAMGRNTALAYDETIQRDYAVLSKAMHRGPRAGCAIARPRAATSCSGCAADIFAITSRPATSASQVAAALGNSDRIVMSRAAGGSRRETIWPRPEFIISTAPVCIRWPVSRSSTATSERNIAAWSVTVC